MSNFLGAVHIHQSHLNLYFYLSYLPGLNRRPPPYQGDALPTELKQQVTKFWTKKKELRK